jgi:hypothetical protein
MHKLAKKHLRRIEVLAIILALIFVPAIFITRVAPEAQSTISAPYLVVNGLLPLLGAWIILEIFQLIVVHARASMTPLGTTELAQWYFIGWIVFVATFLFILYSAVGNIDWVNYFYYQIPETARRWLLAFSILGFLKLVPVIFYKRHRPM